MPDNYLEELKETLLNSTLVGPDGEITMEVVQGCEKVANDIEKHFGKKTRNR